MENGDFGTTLKSCLNTLHVAQLHRLNQYRYLVPETLFLSFNSREFKSQFREKYFIKIYKNQQLVKNGIY